MQLLAIPVETIGMRYGAIPTSLPSMTLPIFSWETIREVSGSAISIALLAGIESLLCALVADNMLKGRPHRSDIELVAQGASNMAAALFLGLPATGAIARTATNVKNGGRTPLAAMVNCATILLIMLFFGHYVIAIPMCVLSAIMALVCYTMVEWRSIFKIVGGNWQDRSLLLATFFTTIFVGLSEAIGVGVLLASLFFMVDMTACSRVKVLPSEDPNVTHLQLKGSFFFGSLDKLKLALLQADTPKVIFHCDALGFIDGSAAHFLGEQAKQAAAAGRSIQFTGMTEKQLKRIHDLHHDPLPQEIVAPATEKI